MRVESVKALQRLTIYAFKRHQDHRRPRDLERQYVERSLKDLGGMIDPELVTRKMVLITSESSRADEVRP